MSSSADTDTGPRWKKLTACCLHLCLPQTSWNSVMADDTDSWNHPVSYHQPIQKEVHQPSAPHIQTPNVAFQNPSLNLGENRYMYIYMVESLSVPLKLSPFSSSALLQYKISFLKKWVLSLANLSHIFFFILLYQEVHLFFWKYSNYRERFKILLILS